MATLAQAMANKEVMEMRDQAIRSAIVQALSQAATQLPRDVVNGLERAREI